MNNQFYLAIAVTLLIVIVGGYFVYRGYGNKYGSNRKSAVVDMASLENEINIVLNQQPINPLNPSVIFVHTPKIVAALKTDLDSVRLRTQESGDQQVYNQLIEMSKKYVGILNELLGTTNAYEMLGGYESGGPKENYRIKKDDLYNQLITTGDSIALIVGEQSQLRTAQKSLVSSFASQKLN